MISLFKVFMSEDVIKPVSEVLMSGVVTQGTKVDEFEEKLSEYLDNPRTLTLSSATSGLTLALKLLIKPSDTWPGFDLQNDVILTPSLTCFAGTSAILANHAKLRWLDVDINTANVDLDDLERKLDAHTKAICIVLWGGCPIDLNRLDNIRENHKEKFGFKPVVILDCAHAFGSEFDGVKIGNKDRDYVCVFSFQAIKTLTTCDGGCITLPDNELYGRCKLLRWFGISRDVHRFKNSDSRLENDIEEAGLKANMNNLSAVIGIHNLPHIDRILATCRENAQFYNEQLNNINGVSLMTYTGNSSFWLYSLRVERKEDFMIYMKENNIMCSQVHMKNHCHSVVAEFMENLPNLNILETQLVCIPVGWWVTPENREYIVLKIREFYQ